MEGSIGVVVPAYDPDVDRLRAYLRALETTVDPDALRVELDAPAPETVEALADAPGTVNAVDRRRGKGAAIGDGFDALGTDLLAFSDADGSTPAAALLEVVRGLEAADLSVGSRRHPAATVSSHQGVLRRVLGDGFAWLARRALPAELHDYQCGAKALRADTWEHLRTHVTETGFAWDVEVVGLAGALDQRVVEVPVDWEDRPGSTVAPLATAVELGRALVDVHRRIDRIDRIDATGGGRAPAGSELEPRPKRKPAAHSRPEPKPALRSATGRAGHPRSAGPADD